MNLDGVRHYRDGVAGFSRNARLYIAGGIFNGLGMSVFGLLFNLYLKEHAFTESQIGQVLSAGSLGATLAAIPAALVLERICVKRVLIWSTLLAAGCYTAMIALKPGENQVSAKTVANSQTLTDEVVWKFLAP